MFQFLPFPPGIVSIVFQFLQFCPGNIWSQTLSFEWGSQVWIEMRWFYFLIHMNHVLLKQVSNMECKNVCEVSWTFDDWIWVVLSVVQLKCSTSNHKLSIMCAQISAERPIILVICIRDRKYLNRCTSLFDISLSTGNASNGPTKR